jgi:hypothetical protein
MGAGPGVVVVVVVFGSMVVVVVVPGSTVVVVVTMVVVVGSGTDGAGGVISDTAGVSGTAGKRSARVVGRQYAWAGATATTETKAAQAKKSVVTRFLKVSSGYPPAPGVRRGEDRVWAREVGAGARPTSHVARARSLELSEQKCCHGEESGETHQVGHGCQEEVRPKGRVEAEPPQNQGNSGSGRSGDDQVDQGRDCH